MMHDCPSPTSAAPRLPRRDGQPGVRARHHTAAGEPLRRLGVTNHTADEQLLRGLPGAQQDDRA